MTDNNKPGAAPRALADVATSEPRLTHRVDISIPVGGDVYAILTRTDDTAPAGWRADAEDAVLRLAALGEPLGADDVRALGVLEPDHPNRWGALFRALHEGGHIVPVSFTTSGRRARRAGVLRLWRGVPA